MEKIQLQLYLKEMELMNEGQLQILAERTWNLHGVMSEIINRNGFSFCSNCSNHGRYCVVADNRLEERGSVVAVKDSLKDVYNNILYLQMVKTSPRKNIDEAVANLEESITLVVDKVNQFPEKQRNFGILEELTTFLADIPRKSNRKMDERMDQRNYENGISRFLISTARFAFEYAVIFASIYATVKFRESTRQRDYNDSIDKVELLVADSSIHLDVLRGRG